MASWLQATILVTAALAILGSGFHFVGARRAAIATFAFAVAVPLVGVAVELRDIRIQISGDWGAWTDAATVAAAVFAFGATVAAWRSAREARLAFESAQRADLVLRIQLDAEAGSTEVIFVNAGGGIATSVGYMLVAAGRRHVDAVTDGFLYPGDKVRVGGAIPHDDGAQCVVAWIDADGTGWATGPGANKVRLARGHEWRHREQGDWGMNPAEIWARVYDDAEIFRIRPPFDRKLIQTTVEPRR